MNVAVILVNWNGKTDTAACLDTLEAMERGTHKVAVFVVDNASADDSVAYIGKQHPWVRIIRSGTNLGFAGGNNLGLRHALEWGADAVWLLNNDTLADRKALFLADSLKGAVGISGSKIYFAKGHEYHSNRYTPDQRGRVLWYAGGMIDWANMYASHRGVDEVDHGQYDNPESTDYVSGCSMMIRRDVIEKTGYLDERYFMYLEDLDYCMRARRKGFDLLYNPRSVIWHVNAGSSGGSGSPLHEYYQTRNRLRIGFLYASRRTKIALIREGLRFLAGPNRVRRQAVVDALTGRWGNRYAPK